MILICLILIITLFFLCRSVYKDRKILKYNNKLIEKNVKSIRVDKYNEYVNEKYNLVILNVFSVIFGCIFFISLFVCIFSYNTSKNNGHFICITFCNEDNKEEVLSQKKLSEKAGLFAIGSFILTIIVANSSRISKNKQCQLRKELLDEALIIEENKKTIA